MWLVIGHDGEDKYSNHPWAIGPFDSAHEAYDWAEERYRPGYADYVEELKKEVGEDANPADSEEWIQHSEGYEPWEYIHYSVVELQGH